LRSPVEALIWEARARTGELAACRREIKLVLPADVADELEVLVQQHLPPEEFVAGRLLSVIHTVYFDTPDFALYRKAGNEGLNLPDERPGIKFRIRAYGENNPARTVWDKHAYLEIKAGFGPPEARQKAKARLKLSQSRLDMLMTPGGIALAPNMVRATADLRPRGRFWNRAVAYARDVQLEPRVTVWYQRSAYASEYGHERVTFDRGYRATRIGHPTTSDPAEAPATLDGRVVLEVKYLDAFPAWLAPALEARGLPLSGLPFSKYRAAVPTLYPAVASRC
jgi:hypothetical protein